LEPASISSFAREPFLRLRKSTMRTVRTMRADDKEELGHAVAYISNE